MGKEALYPQTDKDKAAHQFRFGFSLHSNIGSKNTAHKG